MLFSLKAVYIQTYNLGQALRCFAVCSPRGIRLLWILAFREMTEWPMGMNPVKCILCKCWERTNLYIFLRICTSCERKKDTLGIKRKGLSECVDIPKETNFHFQWYTKPRNWKQETGNDCEVITDYRTLYFTESRRRLGNLLAVKQNVLKWRLLFAVARFLYPTGTEITRF